MFSHPWWGPGESLRCCRLLLLLGLCAYGQALGRKMTSVRNSSGLFPDTMVHWVVKLVDMLLQLRLLRYYSTELHDTTCLTTLK